jgi:hypothetical protein
MESKKPLYKKAVFWIFIGTMLLAGATKSQVVIGVFWWGWAFYWVVRGLRKMKAAKKTKTTVLPDRPMKSSKSIFQSKAFWIFIATMWIAGSTKLPVVIVLWLFAWSIYWLVLGIRRITKKHVGSNVQDAVTEAVLTSNRIHILDRGGSTAGRAVDSAISRTRGYELTKKEEHTTTIFGKSKEETMPEDIIECEATVQRLNDFVDEVYSNNDTDFASAVSRELELSNGQRAWLNKLGFVTSLQLLETAGKRRYIVRLYLSLIKEADDLMLSYGSSLRRELIRVDGINSKNIPEDMVSSDSTTELYHCSVEEDFATSVFAASCAALRSNILRMASPKYEYFLNDKTKLADQRLLAHISSKLKQSFELYPPKLLFIDYNSFYLSDPVSWMVTLSNLEKSSASYVDDIYDLISYNEGNKSQNNLCLQASELVASQSLADGLFIYSEYARKTRRLGQLPLKVPEILNNALPGLWSEFEVCFDLAWTDYAVREHIEQLLKSKSRIATSSSTNEVQNSSFSSIPNNVQASSANSGSTLPAKQVDQPHSIIDVEKEPLLLPTITELPENSTSSPPTYRSIFDDELYKPKVVSNAFVEEVPNPDYHSYAYTNVTSNNPYGFGASVKKDLTLTDGELRWLNSFSANLYDDLFKIKEFRDFAAKLYLYVLKQSDEELRQHSSSIRLELESVGDQWFSRRSESTFQGWFDSAPVARYRAQGHFAWYLFSKVVMSSVENSIVGNQLCDLSKAFDPITPLFRQDFLKLIEHQIEKYYSTFEGFSNRALKIFYERPNRWKKALANIALTTDLGRAAFFKLCEVNERNPTLRNLFFEGMLAFGSGNRLDALECYSMHLILSIRDSKHPKPFPTALKKECFTTRVDLERWKNFIQDIQTSQPVQMKLRHLIEDTFSVKPRTIILDTKQIKRIEKTHSKTVEVLDDILSDEETIIDDPVAKQSDLGANNRFNLEPKQRQFLELLREHGYSLTASEVGDFCKTNNIFKSTIIDGINEAGYEVFNDLLIEETDTGCRIAPDLTSDLSSLLPAK